MSYLAQRRSPWGYWSLTQHAPAYTVRALGVDAPLLVAGHATSRLTLTLALVALPDGAPLTAPDRLPAFAWPHRMAQAGVGHWRRVSQELASIDETAMIEVEYQGVTGAPTAVPAAERFAMLAFETHLRDRFDPARALAWTMLGQAAEATRAGLD